MTQSSSREIAHEHAYREWLSEKYQGKQLSDQVSRTRRILRMIDVAACSDLAELEVELLRVAELQHCSISVRSQLKRAARLYHTFLGADE